MQDYTNFNRQNNFNRIELSFLNNTIRIFSDYGGSFNDFINKLHGLQDGYLYNNLLELCDTFILESGEEAKKEGNLVALYRAKADLKLIIEKAQKLPAISQNSAISLL